MNRRGLLTLGIVWAAVLALGGGALALLQPGLQDGRLTGSGRTVFASLGRGLLDGSPPSGADAMRVAIDGLLFRIDALVAGLPRQAQAELSQQLRLILDSSAGQPRARPSRIGSGKLLIARQTLSGPG